MKPAGKKLPPLGFETQLKTVPYRNQRVRVTKPADNPDALVVETELAYHGVIKQLGGLLKLGKTKKYQLEGLARECYERIDGHRSVEQFIDELMVAHKLTFFEARALIAQYLKDLMQRGLVVIAGEGVELHSPSEANQAKSAGEVGRQGSARRGA